MINRTPFCKRVSFLENTIVIITQIQDIKGEQKIYGSNVYSANMVQLLTVEE